MNASPLWKPDPTLDLVLERIIDVPPELVWAAWTQAEHLTKWFCPVPWKVVECEMDLRPGGIFHTVMQGPNGESHSTEGCYLEIVPKERLVWTLTLLPGFRPSANPFLPLTAVITLKSEGNGTRYTALAMHRDAETCQRHADMGFHEGWGITLDQLVAHAKKM